jgi:C-terminal processing protease CtpA/Prc
MLERALALVAGPKPARRGGAGRSEVAAPPVVGWQRDAVYADSPYPSRELRLLALFRFWSVIEHFYPYLHLMGDSWDRALTAFIPRFEAAADAKAYALVVAELAALIPDGHVNVRGGALGEVIGVATPPITVRRVEGRPAVTELLDPAAAKAAGISVGDVLVSVDGEDFEARARRLSKYAPASNPWAHEYRVCSFALLGPAGPATLVVEGEGGRRKEAKLARLGYAEVESAAAAAGESKGEPYRMLDGGVGYVDLSRLQRPQVEAMFQALEKANGIVFDMRGYPHGTGWQIAPRLNVRDAPYGALFLKPLLSEGEASRVQFFQPIAPAEGPKFRGPTVMLVHEATMSQAEHTGLMFAAANGTRFVGAPTAGANGDITNTCLPGGICVSFTGQEVRYPDGRQLQRIGLAPLIPAQPTLAGLRAGKDEVLERGVEVLREEIASRSKAPDAR